MRKYSKSGKIKPHLEELRLLGAASLLDLLFKKA
jgi:hypothetical protein